MTTGATTTTSGWAAELVTEQLAGFIATTASAAGKLIARGVSITVEEGTGVVKVPQTGRAEQHTMGSRRRRDPCAGMGVDAVSMEPRKMAVMISFTKELAEHSSGETVIRQMLSEQSAAALDSRVFSEPPDRPQPSRACLPV